MLGDSPYLVGDRPTLADGLLVGVARWLDFHQVADASRWPELAAVRQRIESDAAVVYAAVLESGQMQTGGGACKEHVDLEDVVRRFGS